MSAIPILTFGLSQTFRWREFTKSSDETEAINLARSLHQEMNRILDLRLSALEVVAEQIRLQVGEGPLKADRFYSLLELYVEKYRMQLAGISDLDGNALEVYTHTPSKRPFFLKLNVKPLGFIPPILERRDSYVSTVRTGKITEKNIFVLGTPVWDFEKKNVRAVLAGSVYVEEVQSLSEKILQSSALFEFQILDQDYNVVAETNSKGTHVIRREAIPFLTQAPTEKPEIRTGIGIDGQKLHGAIQRLEIRPGIFWTIAVNQSQESLHRNERQAWVQVIAIAFVGIGSSFLVALFISSLISKPILDLILSMKGYKQGKSAVIIPPRTRLLAFQETQEAWDALSSLTEKINDYTKNLETEVNSRTQELIKTHQELDEQRVRSIESARLASLGEMAGGIAHEINNPLTIISLITQQQRDLIDKDKFHLHDIREAFTKIDTTTFRIAKIIQGLRKFSREGGKDPLEKASLNAIIDSSLTLCHEKFKQHQIQVHWTPLEQDYTLLCRPVQISQVFLNLLSNAFDAIQDLPEKWIEIQVREVDNHVEIRVIDSGHGIDASLKEKIFQPFFTLKGLGKGTGLGLSISKGIIEGHQGKIFVDSTSSHTSFAIQLPRI
jgi:signal transduction histidine kinase